METEQVFGGQADGCDTAIRQARARQVAGLQVLSSALLMYK